MASATWCWTTNMIGRHLEMFACTREVVSDLPLDPVAHEFSWTSSALSPAELCREQMPFSGNGKSECTAVGPSGTFSVNPGDRPFWWRLPQTVSLNAHQLIEAASCEDEPSVVPGCSVSRTCVRSSSKGQLVHVRGLVWHALGWRAHGASPSMCRRASACGELCGQLKSYT